MFLHNIGVAYPDHTLNLSDRSQIAQFYVRGNDKDRWFAESIFEKTRIQSRPSVLLTASEGDLRQRQSFFPTADECATERGPSTGERMRAYRHHAPGLAAEACENAFQSTDVHPRDITHLVTASCTGFSAPGFDLELLKELPLSRTVKRTHIGFMGCHAGLNCLRVASAFARSEPESCVLLCATELCGLHFQYVAAPDQMIANALFADGAGAAIMTGSARDDRRSAWRLVSEASCVIPDTSELMQWHIEDHGFAMTLSDRIPDVIKCEAGPWLRDWLQEQGLSVAEISGWAVHPGGPQILNAFEIAMSLDPRHLAPSRELLAEKGNMSSAAIFFLLQRLQAQPRSRPCVAVGFGPGLTMEVALFR